MSAPASVCQAFPCCNLLKPRSAGQKGPNRMYCSRKCNMSLYTRLWKESDSGVICSVEGCGRPHRAKGKCSTHYNQDDPRRHAGRRPEIWDDRRRDHYHRRRALKKSTSTGVPVLLAEVAERDGYACHVCGLPVDMGCMYPNPFSPSQDHVIPLSRGGVHDPSNVRLAHLRCNRKKWDTIS